MKIAIACDHAAFNEKNEIAEHLRASGHEVMDCGCHSAESVDYPAFAKAACELVQKGEAESAVLLCGTGIGMAMAANKLKGIRAALLHEPFSAKMTREHNNANVICFGARVVGVGIMKACCDAYLAAEFEGGKHARRVDGFMAFEC
ncbi:MAG: ribose 5-phosphate isomerase B [Planctomycetes bacterium]|nr:ribose 5-phosphate isomerase B [Planctomycetota bacterium]